jgi:hypothetical protein
MTIQRFLRTYYWSVLLVSLALPAFLAAQQEQQARPADRFPHYIVEDLGTLGGPYSFSYNLNNAGVVSGGSATPTQNGDPSQAVNNAPQTASLWDRGHLRNLGALGGPDSAAAAANLFHLAVVDSENQQAQQGGGRCMRMRDQSAVLGCDLERRSPQPAFPPSRRQQFLRTRHERWWTGGRVLRYRCLRYRLRCGQNRGLPISVRLFGSRTAAFDSLHP